MVEQPTSDTAAASVASIAHSCRSDAALPVPAYGSVMRGFGRSPRAKDLGHFGAMLLGEGCGVSAVEEILRIGHVPHVFVTGDTSRTKAFGPGAVVMKSRFVKPTSLSLRRALDTAIAS